jgi:hypothetical protein
MLESSLQNEWENAIMMAKGEAMQTEASIGKTITNTSETSQYDASCKKLLSEKSILAWILKQCVSEFQGYEVDEIVGYIEGTPRIDDEPVDIDAKPTVINGLCTEAASIKEGTIRFDILFKAIVPDTDELVGLIINVEAQNNFYPGYPIIKRGLYYGCRLISSQKEKEFFGSKYGEIKKVYSIWVCMNPPKYRRNTINRYSIKEKCLIGTYQENPMNYDILSVVIMCLGGHGERYDGVLKMLDVLLDDGKEADEKKKVLAEEFDIPMTREFETEVDRMCNLSEGVLQKGVQKGRQERAIDLIRNLMETMNLNKDEAMAALRIPEAERERFSQILGENAVCQ